MVSPLIYVAACIVPVLLTHIPRVRVPHQFRRRKADAQRHAGQHPLQGLVPLPGAVIPPRSWLRHSRSSSSITTVSSDISDESSRSSESSSLESVIRESTPPRTQPTGPAYDFPPPGLTPPTPTPLRNHSRVSFTPNHTVIPSPAPKLSPVTPRPVSTNPGQLSTESTPPTYAREIRHLTRKLVSKDALIKQHAYQAFHDRLIMSNRIMNLQKELGELRRSMSMQAVESPRAVGSPQAAVESPRERSRIEVWRAEVPLGLHTGCGDVDDHGMKSPSAGAEISSLLQMLDTLKTSHS